MNQDPADRTLNNATQVLYSERDQKSAGVYNPHPEESAASKAVAAAVASACFAYEKQADATASGEEQLRDNYIG